jgi:hypothetical protein
MNGGGGERATGNISGAGDWRGMGAHACSCSARARPCWVRSSGVRGAPPAGNMSSVAMAYDEYFVQQAGGGGDAHLQRCCHHTMAIWGGRMDSTQPSLPILGVRRGPRGVRQHDVGGGREALTQHRFSREGK